MWTKFESETVEDSLEVTDTDSDQFSNLISKKDIYQVLDNPYSPHEHLFAEGNHHQYGNRCFAGR